MINSRLWVTRGKGHSMRKTVIFFLLLSVLLTGCLKNSQGKKAETEGECETYIDGTDEKYNEIYEKLSEARNTVSKLEVPDWIMYTKTAYDSEERGREFVYCYNEENDSFDCFYVYEDVVIYCTYDGTKQIVTIAYNGSAIEVPWRIYHIYPNAFGLEIRKSDVTKDGNKDLLVSVTDEENNVIHYIFDLQKQKDISPYYAKEEYSEASGYSFTREYLYYEYGQPIAEAINAELVRQGTKENSISADKEKGLQVGGSEFYRHTTYITKEGQLRLVYTYVKSELIWECRVLFDITENGCSIADISVITEREESQGRETYPLGETENTVPEELPTYPGVH